METSAPAQSNFARYPRVASPIHTILVLTVVCGWAISGNIFANRLAASTNPNRMRTYLATILIEWAAFVLVVVGVRRSGTSVFLVLGDRWRSFRQFLRDIGVAVGFWVVAVLFLFMAGRLLHVASAQKKLHFVLPHGGFEIATWIALSITAGICEETIFRGYLQRQFMALTQSAPAGILFSAATFGAAHAYQGLRLAIVIGVFGAMFGVLAYWRGTVRPGMIAHAWQDSLSGIVGSLIKH